MYSVVLRKVKEGGEKGNKKENRVKDRKGKYLKEKKKKSETNSEERKGKREKETVSDGKKKK